MCFSSHIIFNYQSYEPWLQTIVRGTWVARRFVAHGKSTHDTIGLAPQSTWKARLRDSSLWSGEGVDMGGSKTRWTWRRWCFCWSRLVKMHDFIWLCKSFLNGHENKSHQSFFLPDNFQLWKKKCPIKLCWIVSMKHETHEFQMATFADYGYQCHWLMPIRNCGFWCNCEGTININNINSSSSEIGHENA